MFVFVEREKIVFSGCRRSAGSAGSTGPAVRSMGRLRFGKDYLRAWASSPSPSPSPTRAQEGSGLGGKPDGRARVGTAGPWACVDCCTLIISLFLDNDSSLLLGPRLLLGC